MADASIFLDIIGRDRASDEFTKVGKAADRSSSKMGKFGAALKTGAKVGTLALAGGALVAGKALFDMTKNAVADEAAQRKLALALKNSTGATDGQVASVEDWISAQGKALGVTDDELRPAFQRLVQATGDVGKAQELSALAMDAAAGSGKSLESVSMALVRAQNGNISAVGKLGIKTKDANGETISFEQAQKRLAQTFKGQAQASAGSLEGKMNRLKVMFDETKEAIGARLIPVVTKMVDWFLVKALPAIEKFGAWLGTKLPPIFDKVREVIGKFTGDGSGKFSKFIADVKGIVSDGVTIVRRLWEAFGDNILAHLKATFSAIKKVLSGAFQIIKGLFKVVSGVLKGDWKKVWSGIKDILRGAIKIVVGLVKALWSTLKFAFKNAGVVLKAVWKATWEGIKNLAAKGKDWVVAQIKQLPTRLKALAGLYRDAGKWLIEKAIDIMKDKAREGVQWIKERLGELPGKIRDLGGNLREAGAAMMGKLFDGIRSAVSGVAGFAADIASSIRHAINDALNLPFTINGPGPLPDFTIPAFAAGTRFAPGGLALVGERGPELVNLPRGSQVYSAAESRRMASAPVVDRRGSAAESRRMASAPVVDRRGSQAPPTIVQLVLPNGRVIEQILIEHQRSSGRPLQVRTLGATG